MNEVQHILHKKIGKAIFTIGKQYGFEVLVDTDCKFKGYSGKDQRLPFFLSFRPARESEVSCVDIVLIKDGKVKLLCEIEESDFKPTKIFGKLFSSSSAKICKLNNGEYYELDKNSVFIQIISNKNLPDSSLKKKQGQLIENEIYYNLKLINSWISEYRLIYGDEKYFEKSGGAGYNEIERMIKYL